MDANPRAAIGDNNPPIDQRVQISAAVAELQGSAAELLAERTDFFDDEIMGAAAALKREIEAAAKAAETARKQEKQPHDDAGKAVQAFWLPVIARAQSAADALSGKMKAELLRRKMVKELDERSARALAERLAAEAEEAAVQACEALDDVAAGVVPDINHLEAKAAAIDAHNKAKAAADEVERIAKTTAGVKVAGAAAVSIRTTRKVRIAFTIGGTREQRALALLDFMECISHPELTDTMTRLANRVYRDRKIIPPYCEEYDEESVV